MSDVSRRGFLRGAAGGLAATAVPGAAAGSGAADLDEIDREMIEAARAAEDSPGGRQLLLFAAALKTATRLAYSFLDEHGFDADCRCAHCSCPDHHDLAEDVCGMLWPLARLNDILDGGLAITPAKVLTGESYGDDLRKLAAMSDAIDAE